MLAWAKVSPITTAWRTFCSCWGSNPGPTAPKTSANCCESVCDRNKKLSSLFLNFCRVQFVRVDTDDQFAENLDYDDQLYSLGGVHKLCNVTRGWVGSEKSFFLSENLIFWPGWRDWGPKNLFFSWESDFFARLKFWKILLTRSLSPLLSIVTEIWHRDEITAGQYIHTLFP